MSSSPPRESWRWPQRLFAARRGGSPIDLELRDRTALITGASAGIGRGIAEVLAREGVRVALVARRRSVLEQLTAELPAAPNGGHLAVVADLAAPGAADKAGTRVLRAFGHVDILVNNAGGSRPAPPGCSEEVWTQSLTLGFTAARRLAEILLPSMRKRAYGRIVNITGANEPTHLNADQAAKAAQASWAKGLSREVARDGITVNSVAPGRILSEQITRMYPTAADRERFAAEHVPTGYFGEPHDVGYMVAFLASPRARYVTGAFMYVDGGYHRFTF